MKMYRAVFYPETKAHHKVYKELRQKHGAHFNRSTLQFELDFKLTSDPSYQLLHTVRDCIKKVLLVDLLSLASPKEEMDEFIKPRHVVVWTKKRITQRTSTRLAIRNNK